MTEQWTVQACFDPTGNGKRFRPGDSIVGVVRSEAPSLTIQGSRNGRQTVILDVTMRAQLGGYGFARDSRRRHEPSRRFRGHACVVRTEEDEEVLVVHLGHREDGSSHGDDDDDTEVVVATRPAGM